MKKAAVTTLIILVMVFTISQNIYAVNPTPTDIPPPAGGAIRVPTTKQIEILMNKIASKVAELRQNDKRATSGSVKSVNDTFITIDTKKGEQKVSYAEDTVFFIMTGGVKSDPLDSKQVKKLKPGEHIAALGYFDSTGTSLATKYIYVYNPRIRITGKIADKDATNYTISVKGLANNTLVDIETYTKIYTYSKKGGLVKGGFTKLKENDIVHIFATVNPKEDNRVSGNKIISLSIGGIVSPTPTEEKEASSTAKSTEK